MAITAVDTIPHKIDELSSFSFSTVLTIPDGAGGERHPTLSEITALELTVYLEGGSDITAYTYGSPVANTWAQGSEVLKNINIEDTGRGDYNEATGLLTVTLHAGDNPFLTAGAAVGATEIHVAYIAWRWNSNQDEAHKRVRFTVENLAKAPRIP